MVYVKEDETEEVTDVYMSSESGVEYVVIETDDGYFIYKIPVVDAPDYVDDKGKVLDMARSDMKIIEAPNSENRSEYDGFSWLTVPQKVVDAAEEESGASLLE